MSTILLIIATNLGSAFIGWILGRTGRNAAKVAAAVAESEQHAKEVGVRPFRWIIVAVLVVCGVTAANGVYISINQNKFSECVSGQFDKLVDALETRAAASRNATLQLDKVFTTIVEVYQNPTPDASAKVQGAIIGYAQSRAKAEQNLKRNPFPEPPRNACRE